MVSTFVRGHSPVPVCTFCSITRNQDDERERETDSPALLLPVQFKFFSKNFRKFRKTWASSGINIAL